MGDIGLFKRNPRDWTPAHAYPRGHKPWETVSTHESDGGSALEPGDRTRYMDVVAWDREMAVERAVEERKGGIEAIAGEIFSPF